MNNKIVKGLAAISGNNKVFDQLNKEINRLAKRAAEDLKKSAAAFNKLTPAKKAVALAEDVLQQISAKSYNIQSGSYVETDKWDELDADENFNKPLSTIEGISCLVGADCHVCAKGALFLSSAIKTNKLSTYDVVNSSEQDMHRRLVVDEGVFDPDTFDLLEMAFEGDTCPAGETPYWDVTNAIGRDIDTAESELYDVNDELKSIAEGFGDTSEVKSLKKKKIQLEKNIAKLSAERDARNELADAAARYGSELSNDTAIRRISDHHDYHVVLLVALMLNIIKNKGKFNVEYFPKASEIKAVLK